MHTVVAYSESITPDGSEVNIAAVEDQHMKTSGDEITIAEYNRIIGSVLCGGSTVSRGKLITPSLRGLNPYDINPLVAALFPTGLYNYNMHPGSPIPLQMNESMEAFVTAATASASQLSAVVFLTSGDISQFRGNIAKVRFSFTVTKTAGSWKYANVTFIDDLPVANYDVVGADVVCAAAVAFRFVPVGGGARPGAPARNAVDSPIDPVFRNGNLGVWFSFNTVQLPGIEILASASASSATFYGTMDLVRRQ